MVGDDYLYGGQWWDVMSMVDGQWSMVNGQWSMVDDIYFMWLLTVMVDGNYIGDYNYDYNMWSMVMVNVNDSVHECILSFVILTQQPSENI